MQFYKIESPKLSQFIEAVETMQYFTMEQFNQKKRQIAAYFENTYNDEYLITYLNVTNSGGYPVIFARHEDIYSILSDFYGDDWEEFTNDEKEHEVELFLFNAKTIV